MKRLILNPMTKGACGKSFEAECRVCWYDSYDISWSGADLDNVHKNFSRRHPQDVELMPVTDEKSTREVLNRIVNHIIQSETTLYNVDVCAQVGLDIAKGLYYSDMINRLLDHGVKTTIIIIPVKDQAADSNCEKLVKSIGSKAEYVIVKNYHICQNTNFFVKKDLEKLILDYGAKTIEIQPIADNAREALNYAEDSLEQSFKNGILPKDKKTGVTFTEAAAYDVKGNVALPKFTDSGEFALLLSRMYHQYDKIADLIVDSEQIKLVTGKYIAESPKLFNFD